MYVGPSYSGTWLPPRIRLQGNRYGFGFRVWCGASCLSLGVGFEDHGIRDKVGVVPSSRPLHGRPLAQSLLMLTCTQFLGFRLQGFGFLKASWGGLEFVVFLVMATTGTGGYEGF